MIGTSNERVVLANITLSMSGWVAAYNDYRARTCHLSRPKSGALKPLRPARERERERERERDRDRDRQRERERERERERKRERERERENSIIIVINY